MYISLILSNEFLLYLQHCGICCFFHFITNFAYWATFPLQKGIVLLGSGVATVFVFILFMEIWYFIKKDLQAQCKFNLTLQKIHTLYIWVLKYQYQWTVLWLLFFILKSPLFCLFDCVEVYWCQILNVMELCSRKKTGFQKTTNLFMQNLLQLLRSSYQEGMISYLLV